MGEKGIRGIIIRTPPTQKDPLNLQEERMTIGAAAIENPRYLVIPDMVECKRLNTKPGTTGYPSQIPTNTSYANLV